MNETYRNLIERLIELGTQLSQYASIGDIASVETILGNAQNTVTEVKSPWKSPHAEPPQKTDDQLRKENGWFLVDDDEED